MRRLLINADDLGLSQAITDGIVQACQAGIVRSTSLIANMPAAEYAAAASASLGDVTIGIHFNLTEGMPVCPADRIPSLVGPDGRFIGYVPLMKRAGMRTLDLPQVQTELEAQLARANELGFRLTHWDSHHHSCILPGIYQLAAELARRHGIERCRVYRMCYPYDRLSDRRWNWPVRRFARRVRRLHKSAYFSLVAQLLRRRYGMRSCDGVLSESNLIPPVSGAAFFDRFLHTLCSVPEGTWEFMTHPGLLDENSLDTPQFSAQRVDELKALVSPRLRKALAAENLILVNYESI